MYVTEEVAALYRRAVTEQDPTKLNELIQQFSDLLKKEENVENELRSSASNQVR
jgi:hypothetical protein